MHIYLYLINIIIMIINSEYELFLILLTRQMLEIQNIDCGEF